MVGPVPVTPRSIAIAPVSPEMQVGAESSKTLDEVPWTEQGQEKRSQDIMQQLAQASTEKARKSTSYLKQQATGTSRTVELQTSGDVIADPSKASE